jgi:glucose-6-phosphate isomerase
MHRGHREETMDYAGDPIVLDHSFAMSEFVGEAGGAGRPNLTIKLPEINAFTIGQLMHLWQFTVVSLAGLLHVNPFDESEAGSVQKTIYGLLGRPRYEAPRQEFDQTLPLQDKYIL